MDNKSSNSTAGTGTNRIGSRIDAMLTAVTSQRKVFERRWYDNNFFDDGYHYRFISRNTGRIVDLSEKGTIYNPQRAIPKASKQIRSIANTLLQAQYVPVIYPKRPADFSPEENPQLFQQMLDDAQKRAKQASLWVKNEWEVEHDMQAKIAYLIILAAKHGVSFLKIWPDPKQQKINTAIRDAFDIYILGNYSSQKSLPFMVEVSPTTIAEIKANPNFDEEQLARISPDNKYAHSEIKDAYMRAKYGTYGNADTAATINLKEAFLKEYINEDNLARIRQQKNAEKILAGKNKGDIVYRQVFVAGDIPLRDRYTDLRDYPYIPLQLEPGPFYQTPLIERFISQNKTLDTIVSRVERYTNTMASGAWLQRKGENFTPTNAAGATVYQYDVAPPTQLEIAPLPAFIFNFINLMDEFIAEQGMSVVGGKLPKGMKGYQAIESVKATEVANIKMTADQLVKFIKTVTERMMEHAEDVIVKPQHIAMMNKGEPAYLSVVGQKAYDKMGELGLSTTGLTPISKEYSVEINVENGLGYTPEAKKQAALQLAQFMQAMTQQGYIPPQAMQSFVKSLLESYDFGNTQEFMEQINLGNQQQVPQTMLDQIKLAVAQVLQDIAKGGQAQGQPAQPGQPPAPQPPTQQPQPVRPAMPQQGGGG